MDFHKIWPNDFSYNDPFTLPRSREFDNLSLLGGGLFDHHTSHKIKVETLRIFPICLRPSQTIGDVYDFQFSLVGKVWDGRETVKSSIVWDFRGVMLRIATLPANADVFPAEKRQPEIRLRSHDCIARGLISLINPS